MQPSLSREEKSKTQQETASQHSNGRCGGTEPISDLGADPASLFADALTKRVNLEFKKGIHREISLKSLEKDGLFDVPLNEAAKRLGLSAGSLKRLCRKLGLPRWPYRVRKSLKSVIARTEEFLDEGGAVSKQDVLHVLKAQLEDVKGNGGMMSCSTRKYRQTVFKLNHYITKSTTSRKARTSKLKIPAVAAEEILRTAAGGEQTTELSSTQSSSTAHEDAGRLSVCGRSRSASVAEFDRDTLKQVNLFEPLLEHTDSTPPRLQPEVSPPALRKNTPSPDALPPLLFTHSRSYLPLSVPTATSSNTSGRGFHDGQQPFLEGYVLSPYHKLHVREPCYNNGSVADLHCHQDFRHATRHNSPVKADLGGSNSEGCYGLFGQANVQVFDHERQCCPGGLAVARTIAHPEKHTNLTSWALHDHFHIGEHVPSKPPGFQRPYSYSTCDVTGLPSHPTRCYANTWPEPYSCPQHPLEPRHLAAAPGFQSQGGVAAETEAWRPENFCAAGPPIPWLGPARGTVYPDNLAQGFPRAPVDTPAQDLLLGLDALC